jgi:peroxiredoxin
MTQWLLAKGGGLSMIFADGENFSVSCIEEQPSEETIIYTGTQENMYLSKRYRQQQDILGKVDAMRMAMEAYKNDSDSSTLKPFFEEALHKQELAYNHLQEETANSPLYAARFAQIVDITRGLPPTLATNQGETGKLLKDFVLNKLDIPALYTSGHWAGVLDEFMNWYTSNDTVRAAFIPDVMHLLKRTSSDEAYAALAEKAISLCEKKSWQDQQIELAFFLLNDDRIKVPTGRVASLYTQLKIRKGSKAPALTQGALPKKKTILVFYDSSCGNCTAQLEKLSELYPQLVKQGYEVVSVSSDSDKDIFEAYKEKLPWKAVYCDFEGFAGKNFLNYGIVGTPTIYLIDGNGIVQGRYAKTADIPINN